MPTHHGGRHEHGQNFLTDGAVIARVVDLTRRTDGPLVGTPLPRDLRTEDWTEAFARFA